MRTLVYLGSLALLLTILGCSEQKKSTSPTMTTVTQSPPESKQPEPKQPEPKQPEPKQPEPPKQQSSETVTPQTAKPSRTAPTTASAELALANKSGCLACHRIEKKLVGPAWQDVAKRYAGNSEAKQQLIKKVSTGGKGNWTEITGGAPMPPYSPRVSAENIEKLVDFILALPTS